MARSSPIPVTMRTLADTLGLSRTTVSYALNPDWEKLRISPATRERVIKLADALGYSRSQMAVALRTGRSRTIGVLVPFFLGGGEHDLFSGVETGLENRYTLLIGSSRHTHERELQLLRSFDDRMADGLLVTPSPHPETARYLHQLLSKGTPIVQMERYLPELRSSIVEADNEQLSRLCTEHLLSLGHRRIMLLPGPVLHTGTHARLVGYQKAMQAAGLRPWICKEALITREGRGAMDPDVARRIIKGRRRPTAIVGQWFPPIYQTLTGMGVRIPEDLSLISIDLDDSPLNIHRGMWCIKPTLVVWSVEKMGYEAAALLLRELDGKGTTRQHLKIPGRLLSGDSTAPI